MQKNKHNKKEKKLFNPIRLIVLLLIFFSLSFTTIVLSREIANGDVPYDDTGKRLYAGVENLAIRGVSADGEVCEFSNSHSSHDYFIPTHSVQEWDSVKTAGSGNHPHITLGCCGDECCTPYTCSDLDGLASVNNNLNCGLGLDDGCGGTIDCINNCASDQVCATCPPGTDHMECYINPEGGNTKGTCSTDTDCNAVVDVGGINEQGRSFCVVTHEGADCPAQSDYVSVSYEVRHINDECEIYYNGWLGCSGLNLSTSPPYWVTFDDIETETEMLANHDYWASDYIIESCTPDETNGGGGDDDEIIKE